jgi:multidrug efflux pump subunit AcrB
VIALTAIPVSIFITALVFKYFGLSINTMTLGGLAIAIGGLVDDAVVDVENVLRRLKADRAKHPNHRLHPIEVVKLASMEVRSAILYATAIIVLVFMPLFALPGIEGRLFVPLGIAFIVSTLASLLVSVTVTPVLGFYLLPRMKNLDHGDTRVVAWLKARYRNGLVAVLAARARPWLWRCGRGAGGSGGAVLPDHVPAAVQRRHAAHRHAAQPRRHAGRVERAGPPGRSAGAPGARGHARGPAQRPRRAGRTCRRRARE